MGLIATTSKEDKVFDVPFVVVEMKVPLHHAILINTSSDSKLKSHFSLTNYCVPFLWPMFEDFYIQRSAILLAFQRYQKFCSYQAPFSSNFHFSDTTPTCIWAKFAKSAQILYFCLVNLAKNSVKLQLDPPFYGANFVNAT